jgi:hypothetical protein
MNVPQTQNSLFRQLDAVNIVAGVQQAAEQAQRQAALTEQREALHRQGSVGEAEGSQQSTGVGGRQSGDPQGGQEARPRRAGQGPEPETPLQDAPYPGPLGRHFDITA